MTVRQSQTVNSPPDSTGASAIPRNMLAARKPEPIARSASPNQPPMAFIAAGIRAAWAMPISDHKASKVQASTAAPARPVSSDQARANAASVRRLPQRSASQPDGICRAA